MSVGKETQKERLMQQFIDSSPLGSGKLVEDLEDFELELDTMLQEGIDLVTATVRSVLKRMNGGLRG